MQMELKRLAVLRTGKVLAVLYAFIMVLVLPFMLMGLAGSSKGSPADKFMLVLVVLYPLLGFIGGIVLAALYNLAAKWVGGLRFTFEPSE